MAPAVAPTIVTAPYAPEPQNVVGLLPAANEAWVPATSAPPRVPRSEPVAVDDATPRWNGISRSRKNRPTGTATPSEIGAMTATAGSLMLAAPSIVMPAPTP